MFSLGTDAQKPRNVVCEELFEWGVTQGVNVYRLLYKVEEISKAGNPSSGSARSSIYYTR